MRSFSPFLFSLCLLAACGGDSAPADLGGADMASEASVDLGRDASGMCATDLDCSNGIYCDGLEGCSPGTTGADACGCVAAIMGPCLTGQTCDEAMDTCVTTTCTGGSGDADADGHRAVSCGGDDCD